ncbi:hypothetical protein [Nioella aestuarii]|uniref:hypothetical protein n=1 Tax=Nioella aestuarii TaxID=1662864 RepID=UPI003D7FE5F6
MRQMVYALALCVLGTASSACPDYTLLGREVYETTAQELYTPRSLNVVVDGDRALQYCRDRAPNWTGPMYGWVYDEPHFTITIRGLTGYQLEFSVESNCDSVMLINTADGNLYFDDNANGNRDPKIRLTRPAGDGIYDIWIGTYNGTICDGRLIMETF